MVKSASGVFIQPVHEAAADQGPNWARVYSAVRRSIDAGALAPGTRLPSARQLARDWRVARGAVDEAFAQLQLEGLLERRVGAGSWVAAGAGRATQPLHRTPSPAAQRALQQLRAISLPASRTEHAYRTMRPPPLHPRSIPLDRFPLDAWRRLLVQAHDEGQRSLLSGSAPGGLPALRQAIACHLALARGVSCSAEQVLVLSSPREGITAVMGQLLRPGDLVATEDPSHPSLPLLFSTLGARVVGVRLDEQGFDVADLQRRASAARAVYLHPLAQYPLGVRTSATRAGRLLAWASDAQAWLIEGHYNDEWVARGLQPPTLFSRDSAGRVLLLGTFEGVMFPSLRVSYLVLPAPLARRFIDSYSTLGERVPLATQWALAQFIDSGLMTEHLHGVRRDLALRRRLVCALLARVLPPAVQCGPLDNGAQICLHLPAEVPDLAIVEQLRSQGVLVEPLSPIAWEPGAANGIVLGYMGWSDDDVARALGKVGRILSAALASAQAAG